MEKNTTPSATWSQLTESEVVLFGSSAPPATTSTMTLTTTSPSTQPIAKAGPFERALGVPSIRMTATIGNRAQPDTDRGRQQVPDGLAQHPDPSRRPIPPGIVPRVTVSGRDGCRCGRVWR